MPSILELGEETRVLFSVEITDQGRYLAVREEEPRFCLEGASIREACAAGVKALEDWRDFVGRHSR